MNVGFFVYKSNKASYKINFSFSTIFFYLLQMNKSNTFNFCYGLQQNDKVSFQDY